MLAMQVGNYTVEENTTFWIRPENMTKPQRAFLLNETNPGSAVAAETAAAMAAGSMIFRERGKRRLFVATSTGSIMEYGSIIIRLLLTRIYLCPAIFTI